MKSILFILTCVILSGSVLASEDSEMKTLLIIGDSLTEGFGVSKKASYPSQLQEIFKKNGIKIKVNNAGSSGSTTASLKSRLKWHLKKKPDFMMIALGGNDGLRGFPVESSKENLSEAIEEAEKKGIKVILAGMLLPMNFGNDYREKFENMYKQLDKKHELIFIPFLLDGVGGVASLNLPDGIHPNEKGHQKIAQTVFKTLKGKL